jgi:hypothetical protein
MNFERSIMSNIKITERGWAGHHICANRCRFRRNTLLEYDDKKIVVSTVGLKENYYNNGFDEIGLNRYFETMCFYADLNDTRYYDADVTKQIDFDSQWYIDKIDADDEANIMHDNVVKEISEKLLKNEL